MYSLFLSSEQREIRETVRDFVKRELKPAALDPDRLQAPQPALLLGPLHKLSELGLRALAVSEARGGAGADNLTCCIVGEGLAVGDPDIAAVLSHTWTLARTLFDECMTHSQRGRFLATFL